MNSQWQEMLKQHLSGMGAFDVNKEQKNQSVNKRPNELKKKSKLKLGIIKG
jgi:hypothetical protein